MNQIMCYNTVTNGTSRGDALEVVYILCFYVTDALVETGMNQLSHHTSLHWTTLCPRVREASCLNCNKTQAHPVLSHALQSLVLLAPTKNRMVLKNVITVVSIILNNEGVRQFCTCSANAIVWRLRLQTLAAVSFLTSAPIYTNAPSANWWQSSPALSRHI